MYSKNELIAFEKKVYDLFEKGDLPYLIHLCGGNEDQLIYLFSKFNPDCWVFSTHRSHYHYLLKGGNEQVLLDKIKIGDSMFIFDKSRKFFTSSVLAGCAGIAVGTALALKLKGLDSQVICFLGDGAEDEGHFYEAVRFADGMDLNCLFIIEDNDRSVDTDKRQRGSHACFLNSRKILRYNYNPTYPHASTGSGKIVKFNSDIVKDYIEKSSNSYSDNS